MKEVGASTPLTIVVGTGRCGSTMLSYLVNQHPLALSLSEFFACLVPRVFPRGVLDGAEFWELLGTPRLKPNTLMSRGVRVPEYLYPLGRGRYTAGEVPAISLMTLPPLTADPDALHDRIRREVSAWQSAPVSRHYRRLFSWLAAILGREAVVERSGASLRFLPELLTHFPAARVVHLYRHGPDCALSMSRHPLFRLAALIREMHAELGVDPFQVHDPRHAARLPARLSPFTPDTLDPAALDAADLPLVRFGEMWSRSNRALAHLAGLPPERLLHLSYDAVVADPVPHLTRFGRFAGLTGAADWARQVAPLVDRARTGVAARLPAHEAGELDRACAPGACRVADLLGRSGVPA